MCDHVRHVLATFDVMAYSLTAGCVSVR